MPNTGMLDHRAFHHVPPRRHSMVHWMSAWPDTRAGYETAAHSKRVAKFSRHLSKSFQERQVSITSRPSTASLNNSISPFNTIMKPTCGFYFSVETDNRKRRIGINPTDLVSWRPNTARVPRVKTAVH